MRLIALDTAPGMPTLCLWEDGEVIRGWRGEARAGPRPILSALNALLSDSGLRLPDFDAIAFGRGPGAFTGVRLGVALAQGLALGSSLPLVAVSDLAALAWRAGRAHGWAQVLACLDARRGELYWAAYACTESEPRRVTPEAVTAPVQVLPPPGIWHPAGPGAPQLATTTEADATLMPDAEAVAALASIRFGRGETLTAEQASPVYLRREVATPPSGRRLPV